MAAFTVWQFDSAEGAETALDTLERLQARAPLEIKDAALASWPPEAQTPKTRQLHDLAGAGALGGAFWGFLFGLVFFVPLLGIAGGPLGDVGIDDTFVKDVRRKVTPGTSALFLLTAGAVIDSVSEALEGGGGLAALLHSNLSHDQETMLHEAFAEDVPTAA